jgi:hypothetical protein
LLANKALHLTAAVLITFTESQQQVNAIVPPARLLALNFSKASPMAESIPERVPSDTSPHAAYTRFRNDALDITRVDQIVRTTYQKIPVPITLGILTEFGYAGASASMFADLNGNRVSLLFSNGGGYLGGGLHDDVRRAVPPFFEAAKRCLPHLTPASSFPVPAAGQVIFYFLTTSGILAGGGSKDDLGGDRHALSTLYHAGHDVLTHLRHRAEQCQTAGPSAGDRIGKKVCPSCGKDLNVYAVRCRHCKTEL